MIVANSFKTPTADDALAGHDGASNWAPRMFALADVLTLITQQTAAQIAQATIGITQTTADNTGATDATAQLVADLATAIAAGHKRLYVPAGIYSVRLTNSLTGNALFNMTVDGVEVFGDGMGKTIIRNDAAVSLTSDVSCFALRGRGARVHDLSMTGGASTTFNTHQALGVYVQCNSLNTHQGYDCIVERVEVYNWTGGGAGLSGGAGFGTEAAFDVDEYTTTLTAAISATGSQVATPASMNGISVGRLVLIDSEYVQVTAITATTFTATYTATHANGATVHLRSFGRQRAAFVDCIVRDSYYTTGFGVPSNANWFTRCRVFRVGDTNLRHGFYIQGGQNVFEGCHVEGAYGWSYHGWKKGDAQESGGDRFVNCVSIDPGSAHMILSGTTNGGANPSVPAALDLDRYAQVLGCTFRSSGPLAAGYAANFDSPVVFSDNVVENGKVIDTSGGSIVSNNKLLSTAFTSNSATGVSWIVASAGTRVVGNYINGGTIDTQGADVTISGNYVRNYGFSGKAIRANNTATITDNVIDTDTTGIDIGTGAYPVMIERNTITGTVNPLLPTLIPASTHTGRIVGNRIAGGVWRIDNIPAGLLVEGNIGSINANGRAAATLTGLEGPLRIAALASGTALVGYLVKWSSGKLVVIGTSDTAFAGVTYSRADNADEGVLYASAPGREVSIQTDGAWTVGNVGIASTTAAGKIHDSGVTTAPASGSYVVFLDSGASGSARCMLVKTL